MEPTRIIKEDQSTNTYENLTYSSELFAHNGARVLRRHERFIGRQHEIAGLKK